MGYCTACGRYKNVEPVEVRPPSRSISTPMGVNSVSPARLHARTPHGGASHRTCAVELAKSRKIPTRKILPLAFVNRTPAPVPRAGRRRLVDERKNDKKRVVVFPFVGFRWLTYTYARAAGPRGNALPRGCTRADEQAASTWPPLTGHRADLLFFRAVFFLSQAGGEGGHVGVCVASRSISPRWGSTRFRLALRTYAPWGVRVVSQTKSRKIPTRKILPLFFREQGVAVAAAATGRDWKWVVAHRIYPALRGKKTLQPIKLQVGGGIQAVESNCTASRACVVPLAYPRVRPVPPYHTCGWDASGFELAVRCITGLRPRRKLESTTATPWVVGWLAFTFVFAFVFRSLSPSSSLCRYVPPAQAPRGEQDDCPGGRPPPTVQGVRAVLMPSRPLHQLYKVFERC